jgi:hypothetical protein
VNIPRITKNTADHAFVAARCFQATSLVAGQVCQWATGADAVPTGLTIILGLDVVQSSSSIRSFAGVATRTMAVGDFIPIQCYGYYPTVKVDAQRTAGDVLEMAAAGAGTIAAVAAASDIPKDRFGRVLTGGTASAAGVMLKGLGQS